MGSNQIQCSLPHLRFGEIPDRSIWTWCCEVDAEASREICGLCDCYNPGRKVHFADVVSISELSRGHLHASDRSSDPPLGTSWLPSPSPCPLRASPHPHLSEVASTHSMSRPGPCLPRAATRPSRGHLRRWLSSILRALAMRGSADKGCQIRIDECLPWKLPRQCQVPIPLRTHCCEFASSVIGPFPHIPLWLRLLQRRPLP